jgi:hypothetical protein
VSYSSVVKVVNEATDPLNVVGTVASSGTQDVNIVSPVTVPVSIAGTVTTIGGLDPAIDGVYLFSMNDVPGVVAANNFLTLTNPVGSGKIMFMPSVIASTYAYSGGATTSSSMTVSLATAVSGGTVETTNVIAFSDTYPAPQGVVRTGNPTATVGPSLVGVPPPFNSGSGVNATIALTLEANGAAGTYKLKEGESFLFRTAAGDVDQRWNITIAWLEI